MKNFVAIWRRVNWGCGSSFGSEGVRQAASGKSSTPPLRKSASPLGLAAFEPPSLFVPMAGPWQLRQDAAATDCRRERMM
jgi:hypothetical protein